MSESSAEPGITVTGDGQANAIGASVHTSPGTVTADTRGSTGSSVNMFVDVMAKPEKAVLFAAVLVALVCSVYAAARVAALGDAVLDYRHAEESREGAQRESIQRTIDDLKLAYSLGLADDKERFSKLERQYRMTELKLDDWNVTARRAGLVLKGDYSGGAGGNPDAESFNMKPPAAPKWVRVPADPMAHLLCETSGDLLRCSEMPIVPPIVPNSNTFSILPR
jgi:hypothetical protein